MPSQPPNPTPTETLHLGLTDLRGAIAEYLVRRGYLCSPLHLERVVFELLNGEVVGASVTVREEKTNG